jgi:hypothetical protein
MKNKDHNSEFRALLSIKNFNKALEKHYEQMLQIEKNLDELSKNALAIIEAHSSTRSQEQWKTILKEMNNSLSSVNQVIESAKEKVVRRDRSDSTGLWKEFDFYLDKLKISSKTMENFGSEILPESERVHWRKDICNFDDTVLSLINSHARACKVELQLIEKYTPKELNKITQIILDHIPEDFTFEEGDKYEKDYLAAFEEFKKEFYDEKNLWDRFLDVLAGGTHQPPSERIMMSRWLEGEKQDL